MRVVIWKRVIRESEDRSQLLLPIRWPLSYWVIRSAAGGAVMLASSALSSRASAFSASNIGAPDPAAAQFPPRYRLPGGREPPGQEPRLPGGR